MRLVSKMSFHVARTKVVSLHHHLSLLLLKVGICELLKRTCLFLIVEGILFMLFLFLTDDRVTWIVFGSLHGKLRIL